MFVQHLQPLKEEKISSRARPRAVVILSSEPCSTGEIIVILCKLVVKTRHVTQSRALLYKRKIRDCSQSMLKHANKLEVSFAQLRSAFLKR